MTTVSVAVVHPGIWLPLSLAQSASVGCRCGQPWWSAPGVKVSEEEFLQTVYGDVRIPEERRNARASALPTLLRCLPR